MDNFRVFIAGEDWKTRYPRAMAGILVLKNVTDGAANEGLDERRTGIETRVREAFGGAAKDSLAAHPVIRAYENYYRSFGKTYHVRSQVESVVGGKSLARSSAVLAAMFMAEIDNMLLTAGHDLDALRLPLRIGIGTNAETYTDIRGTEKKVLAGDIYMTDGESPISSILMGPDERTKITPATRNFLFAIYAPAGIEKEAVRKELQDIAESIRLFSPTATEEFLEVFGAIST